MIKYVISLNRDEFMALNSYDNTNVNITRDVSKFKSLLKDELPITCYIVVRKGKNNTILFERQVAQENIDELDLNKNINEQLTYEAVERFEANGYIVATAKICDFNAITHTLTMSELNILDSAYSLDKVGLKRIPSAYSKTTKELSDEN